MLSDADIEAAAKTKGVSWAGFSKDASGSYTIPVLSPYHYQFARAIEQAVMAKLKQQEPVAWMHDFGNGLLIARTWAASLASHPAKSVRPLVYGDMLHAPVQQEPVAEIVLSRESFAQMGHRIAELEAIDRLKAAPVQQEPALDLLNQSKANHERQFGASSTADWIYNDLRELLSGAAPVQQDVNQAIATNWFPSALMQEKRITELEAQNKQLLDALKAKLPGGKMADKWDSARVADYNQGWNDYRKAASAAIAAVEGK